MPRTSHLTSSNIQGNAIGYFHPVANRHDWATLGFLIVGGAAFHLWLIHYLGPQLPAVC